jgi:hypothetical protein
MARMVWSLLCVGVISLACDDGVAGGDEAHEIFARRILPLARADRPSSCAECHAAGVDLAQYVRGDAAATFAALKAAGLVNAEQPEKSKLLEFIARAPEKGDAVLAKVRAEELAAFGAWIAAAAKDAKIAKASPSPEPVGPTLPVEVIRHARRDRVLQSFIENIWIERERCAGCHSPDKNQRLIEKHGEHISWIRPNDPAGTLAILVEHELINTARPNKSLILQKPLNEVEHGGHIKFLRGSRTDKQFRRFLSDYAATVTGKYQTAADLPRPSDQVMVATGQHLRLTDLPPDYGGKLMRVDLYRWTDGGWSDMPVAMLDGPSNPKTLVFQSIAFAILPRTSDIAKDVERRRLLPEGRYLAKVYVDRDEKMATNRDYTLGSKELAGELSFDGPWPAGYQPPKILKWHGPQQ